MIAKLSKKELLASATPDINLEDISLAVATVVGKNQTRGVIPKDCPEAHKKFYSLVSVAAIAMGEPLKKRLNGAHALVLVGC